MELNTFRRKALRLFTSEQKILIVMEAMRSELTVAAICRKYGIANALFYKWNKEFMEAGRKRLHGDTELGHAHTLLNLSTISKNTNL